MFARFRIDRLGMCHWHDGRDSLCWRACYESRLFYSSHP